MKQIPHQAAPADPFGFIRRLKGRIDALNNQVRGVLARAGESYGFDDGEPHAFIGERVFEPESASFTLDLLNRGDNAATQQPVNYVVRDGVELFVPVHLDRPGVFRADALLVTIEQRWWSPDQNKEFWFPVPIGRSFNNVLSTEGGTRVQTVKWSVMHSQTFQTWPNVARNTDLVGAPAHEADVCGVNLFWNLVDQESQRRFADAPVSDVVLGGQGYQGQADGGMMAFDAPWLFPRGGQLDFQFRLINPILQLDPSATIYPFKKWDGTAIDDRENGDTERRQSVRVRVEVHGRKFFNHSDLAFASEAS